MGLLDGVLGRGRPSFEDAPGAPGADGRKKGPRPGPVEAVLGGEAVGEDEAVLAPARSHLGRVIDLVG